jgi:hypothetical protein
MPPVTTTTPLWLTGQRGSRGIGPPLSAPSGRHCSLAKRSPVLFARNLYCPCQAVHPAPECPHLVEAKRRDAIKLGFERLGSRSAAYRSRTPERPERPHGMSATNGIGVRGGNPLVPCLWCGISAPRSRPLARRNRIGATFATSRLLSSGPEPTKPGPSAMSAIAGIGSEARFSKFFAFDRP